MKLEKNKRTIEDVHPAAYAGLFSQNEHRIVINRMDFTILYQSQVRTRTKPMML